MVQASLRDAVPAMVVFPASETGGLLSVVPPGPWADWGTNLAIPGLADFAYQCHLSALDLLRLAPYDHARLGLSQRFSELIAEKD